MMRVKDSSISSGVVVKEIVSIRISRLFDGVWAEKLGQDAE
jgi:hypothetical protein